MDCWIGGSWMLGRHPPRSRPPPRFFQPDYDYEDENEEEDEQESSFTRHFFVRSSTLANPASSSLMRRCSELPRRSPAVSSSPFISSIFSPRLRKRASILSRKPSSSRSTLSRNMRNSTLLTNSASIGGRRTKSFLASTTIESTAAAESSQLSIAPRGGEGIWANMKGLNKLNR